MSAKKKNLLVIIAAVLAVLVVLAGGLLDNDSVRYVGVGLLLAVLAMEMAFFRCPSCRRWLGRNFRSGKHCPHCGEIIE